MKSNIVKEPLPILGSVYAVPLKNGQWGLCQIIDVDEKEHAVLGMAFDFMSSVKPELSDIKKSKVLIKTFGSWKNECETVWDPCLDFINTFIFLGISPLHSESITIAQKYRTTTGTLPSFGFSIPAQWYWEHDRRAYEQFQQHVDEEQERECQKIVEKAKQLKEQLGNLTLDDLLKRDWFQQWVEFIDQSLIESSKKIIIDTIFELKKLPKINKQNISKIIRENVLRFNDLDARNHNFISTIEREDICEAFSEIGTVINKEEVDEIVDEWREW